MPEIGKPGIREVLTKHPDLRVSCFTPSSRHCILLNMKPVSAATIRRLEKAARTAAKASYSPYSKFRVGAAVLTARGKTFSGCNVENASYGLCNCAERTAIFTAIAAGESQLRAIVVYTPTSTPTTPCGACRQVINEFGPEAVVISICDSKERLERSLDALLPAAFGPRNLSQDARPPQISSGGDGMRTTSIRRRRA